MLTIYFIVSGLWFYFHTTEGCRLYRIMARQTYRRVITGVRAQDKVYGHESTRTVCKVVL